MTGKNGVVAVQPGRRAAAPGELALVQSFINTHCDLEAHDGADLFATPEALRSWLAGHGLLEGDTPLGEGDLRRAIAVREGLRALARSNAGGAEPSGHHRLNEAARGAVVEVRFEDAGPRFIAGAGGRVDGAIGVVLAIAAKSMLDGAWSRLKVCSGEHCAWAFYDRSRNQSGRWCSMAVCGGRTKARAHYRRHHGQSR
jgi:predicted RNA-binding Zn ribbon-like protein